MNTRTLLRALAVAALPMMALAPSAGFAANAGDPYRNVDRSNDLGNDTGDSRVEGLNSTQLNQNYQGPVDLRAPSTAQPAPQVTPGSPQVTVITPAR
ncbi:MAG: hypothetical protein WDN25_05325 [Acetobacteraceae bacterium]